MLFYLVLFYFVLFDLVLFDLVLFDLVLLVLFDLVLFDLAGLVFELHLRFDLWQELCFDLVWIGFVCLHNWLYARLSMILILCCKRYDSGI